MSEKRNIYGILLLVIGLLAGVGGGYLYVQNDSKPIIDQLSSEETILQEEIQASENTINSLTSNLENIEANIKALNKSIIDTQAQVDSSHEQIGALNKSIELETKKVIELTNQTNILQNYEIFSIYNLWFQYPSGMRFILAEVEENPFSKENGAVIGRIDQGAIEEIIEYYWQYLEFEGDAAVDLDTHVNEYVEYLHESEYNYQVSIGDLEMGEIDGHTSYRKTVFVSFRREEIGRVTYCMWFCDQTGLMYRSVYINFSYKSSVQDRYHKSWQNTYCH